MNSDLVNLDVNYVNTKNCVQDVSQIIDKSRKVVYQAIDVVLLKRNWLIGKRIYEEELKETRKENYGLEIIKKLSKSLTTKFGNGFSKRNLYNFYNFYKIYKNILQTPSAQSLLSWSHYLLLMSINDPKAREWYEKEAINSSWSVRTLKRNINTQYYYRLISSQIKEPVVKEMIDKTEEYQLDKLEHIKNPVILEFLEIPQDKSFEENILEKAIITNLQKMLMELGKGYSFVGRQYRIHTEAKDYYIDLVFYNYILKCFVLIDLKTNRINHNDVGQMDMYVRMFDELVKDKKDNPTLGIVLCSETDEDIAKYSILKGNEQLFATKYKLYLPSEDEIKAEIEYQKELFLLKQRDNKCKK